MASESPLFTVGEVRALVDSALTLAAVTDHTATVDDVLAAAACDLDPPKGSRSRPDGLRDAQPALRAAIERFEEMFDRRVMVAELAAIAHGIDAARAERGAQR